MSRLKKIKLKEILIFLLIIVFSFLPSIIHFLPEDKAIIDLYYFKIDSGEFEDVKFYIWMIAVKISLIMFLIIWFFTCLHWWRLAILVPLTVEMIKCISIFNHQNSSFDEIDYIYSLPIVIPIFSLLILISKKMNQHLYYVGLNKEIDELFSEFNDSFFIVEIETEFNDLKNKKNDIEKSVYLEDLIKIRNKIYNN